jgi:chromosome segregation ATPase
MEGQMGSVHALRDRNYYRMLSDGQLIELTKSAQSELMLVLGERLEELEAAEQAVAELSQEVNDLEERLGLYQDEVLHMQARIDDLELRIADLQNEGDKDERI